MAAKLTARTDRPAYLSDLVDIQDQLRTLTTIVQDLMAKVGFQPETIVTQEEKMDEVQG